MPCPVRTFLTRDRNPAARQIVPPFYLAKVLKKLHNPAAELVLSVLSVAELVLSVAELVEAYREDSRFDRLSDRINSKKAFNKQKISEITFLT